MRRLCKSVRGKELKAYVALEDGRVFEGKGFGLEGEKEGEIVFNTSMTGYQEIMTDPSYKGQIVTMTYPLIGNYGVNEDDVESDAPKVEGFIVREFSKIASNWRATGDLEGYFRKHNIIAVEEIDTRALTRHLRVRGVMKGIISTAGGDPEDLVRKAKGSRGIVGVDLVQEVTCKAPYEFGGPDMSEKGEGPAALRCHGFRGEEEHPADPAPHRLPCQRRAGPRESERHPGNET